MDRIVRSGPDEYNLNEGALAANLAFISASADLRGKINILFFIEEVNKIKTRF